MRSPATRNGEWACKPSSVQDGEPSLCGHSSGPCVTAGLKLPTRGRSGPTPWPPYLELLQVGFNKPACRQAAGALLPHLFTLAGPHMANVGGVFSVPLSVGSPRLRVTKHPALGSSDFPRCRLPAAPRPPGPLTPHQYTIPGGKDEVLFKRSAYLSESLDEPPDSAGAAQRGRSAFPIRRYSLLVYGPMSTRYVERSSIIGPFSKSFFRINKK